MLVDSITMQVKGPTLLITRLNGAPVVVEGDLLLQQTQIFNDFLGQYANTDYVKTQTVLTQDQYTIEVTTEDTP